MKVVNNVDQAITVIHSAGQWLQESGKNPSRWWQPQNLNRKFLLKYAEPEDFYVVLVNQKPAAAAILQLSQRNQDWGSVDKGLSPQAVYIHWLSVARQFAGRGLPKVIVDFAQVFAKSKNIEFLRLDTNADEVKLRKVYEDLGFKLMGIEQETNQKTAFYQMKVD
jgi:ribosomal protein S18 acetylase RimI-like enzyme